MSHIQASYYYTNLLPHGVLGSCERPVPRSDLRHHQQSRPSKLKDGTSVTWKPGRCRRLEAAALRYLKHQDSSDLFWTPADWRALADSVKGDKRPGYLYCTSRYSDCSWHARDQAACLLPCQMRGDTRFMTSCNVIPPAARERGCSCLTLDS